MVLPSLSSSIGILHLLCNLRPLFAILNKYVGENIGKITNIFGLITSIWRPLLPVVEPMTYLCMVCAIIWMWWQTDRKGWLVIFLFLYCLVTNSHIIDSNSTSDKYYVDIQIDQSAVWGDPDTFQLIFNTVCRPMCRWVQKHNVPRFPQTFSVPYTRESIFLYK